MSKKDKIVMRHMRYHYRKENLAMARRHIPLKSTVVLSNHIVGTVVASNLVRFVVLGTDGYRYSVRPECLTVIPSRRVTEGIKRMGTR